MARLRDDLKVMRTEVLKTGDSKLNIPVNVSGRGEPKPSTLDPETSTLPQT
jgi:hypothetical protein